MPMFKKNRQEVVNARGKLLRDALLDNNSTSTKATTTTIKVQLTTRNYSIPSFSGYHLLLPVTNDITPTTSTTTHVHYNLIPMAATHASTMQPIGAKNKNQPKSMKSFQIFWLLLLLGAIGMQCGYVSLQTSKSCCDAQ
jgi:hypothetical protein